MRLEQHETLLHLDIPSLCLVPHSRRCWSNAWLKLINCCLQRCRLSVSPFSVVHSTGILSDFTKRWALPSFRSDLAVPFYVDASSSESHDILDLKISKYILFLSPITTLCRKHFLLCRKSKISLTAVRFIICFSGNSCGIHSLFFQFFP